MSKCGKPDFRSRFNFLCTNTMKCLNVHPNYRFRPRSLDESVRTMVVINVSWLLLSRLYAVVFASILDARDMGIPPRVCRTTLKESVCLRVGVEPLVLFHDGQILRQFHLGEILEGGSCPHLRREVVDGIPDGRHAVQLYVRDVVVEL